MSWDFYTLELLSRIYDRRLLIEWCISINRLDYILDISIRGILSLPRNLILSGHEHKCVDVLINRQSIFNIIYIVRSFVWKGLGADNVVIYLRNENIWSNENDLSRWNYYLSGKTTLMGLIFFLRECFSVLAMLARNYSRTDTSSWEHEPLQHLRNVLRWWWASPCWAHLWQYWLDWMVLSA